MGRRELGLTRKRRFRSSIAAVSFAVAVSLGGCAGAPKDMRLVDSSAGAYVMGDLKYARERAREALELNPDNGYALMTLGAIYERSGNVARARAIYTEVIASRGSEKNATVGVEPTERAALAALARERLAHLGNAGRAKSGGGDEVSFSSGTVKAVFANLMKITDDLRALSSSVSAAAARAEEGTPNAPMMLVPAVDGAEEEAPARAETTLVAVQPGPGPAPEPAASPPASGVKLHLASFRTPKMARKGREEAWENFADILDGFGYDLVRVDLGPGMGVFYRVIAGPVGNEAAARGLCSRLRTRGAFCALVFE